MALAAWYPMHRQSLELFPTRDRTHIAAQIGCNLFPGIQPVIVSADLAHLVHLITGQASVSATVASNSRRGCVTKNQLQPVPACC